MDIYSDKDTKEKVHKSEVTKRLHYLNHYIVKLKRQRNKCFDDILSNDITAKIKYLYLLKERVLIKLVKDGFASVRQMQIGKKSCYCVVRVSRETTFHLPISNELSKLMRDTNDNKKNGPKFCSEQQEYKNK